MRACSLGLVELGFRVRVSDGVRVSTFYFLSHQQPAESRIPARSHFTHSRSALGYNAAGLGSNPGMVNFLLFYIVLCFVIKFVFHFATFSLIQKNIKRRSAVDDAQTIMASHHMHSQPCDDCCAFVYTHGQPYVQHRSINKYILATLRPSWSDASRCRRTINMVTWTLICGHHGIVTASRHHDINQIRAFQRFFYLSGVKYMHITIQVSGQAWRRWQMVKCGPAVQGQQG